MQLGDQRQLACFQSQRAASRQKPSTGGPDASHGYGVSAAESGSALSPVGHAPERDG